MISTVFYLLPPNKRMKHIFQGIGILYAIAIYIIRIKHFALFPQYESIVESYKYQIGFFNLFITLFTLFYISNLYFIEVNTVNDKLNYTSNHDLLTGLFNRRFFEHIMKRNKSENENKYTIALFDIDDFKKVNDTYGHQAGDEVLKKVSKIIEDCAKENYVPVRWGGEEFILYMPQTDGNEAYDYLEKLCEKVRSTIVEFEGKEIKVTMTVGMCTGTNLSDYESVIRDADDRLYYGKRNGKNCVVRKILNENKLKKAVFYFSRAGENYEVGNVEKGSTRILAEIIAEKEWADIFEIKPVVPYPESYEECKAVAKREQVREERPEIQPLPDISAYNLIYVGYPNWWGDLPMCMYTFFESVDLKGKTIVPFCTHEGNGFGQTELNLKSKLSGCRFKNGFYAQGQNVQFKTQSVRKAVEKWLKS